MYQISRKFFIMLARGVAIRRYSTAIEEAKNALSRGELLDIVSKVSQAVGSAEDSNKVHELVQFIQNADVEPPIRDELMNKVLAEGLLNDFSLYFKTPKHHQWLSQALELLIKANPGRVDSLWHLWNKHGKHRTLPIVKEVLEKLLIGERAEIKEQEIDMNIQRLANALELVELSREYKVSDEMIEKLIITSADLKVLGGVALTLTGAELVSFLTKTSDDKLFMRVFGVLFRKDSSLIDKETFSRALALESVVDCDDAGALQELAKAGVVVKNANEVIPVTLDEIVEYVESNSLDCDGTPESLLLRLKLVACHGVYRSDIPKALALFHKYQSHAKFGIELVQNNLCSIFCYQTIDKHSEVDLKVAHTLIGDQLSISLISHLILAKSEFGVEPALDFYNQYILNVSRQSSSEGQRAPLTVLTETMMLGALYNNDREFANLLYEKAVQGQIFGSEAEAASARRLFKVYGDAFEEDSWETAQPKLRQYVLHYIRLLIK